jgi:hypothetical protein
MKISNFILTVFASILMVFGVASPAIAQTGGVKPTVAAGDVVSIDSDKIVLQTKDGSLDVLLSDKTEYKRVPPDNPVLKAAVDATFADIGTGDKLMVTGILSDDKNTLPARAVYLMTKADIAQKQAKESEKWTTKGISGRVASVDPTTNQIKIEVRGLAATTTVVLTPKEGAKLLRYAPNSVNFSEAKASSINEIEAGDMLRASGDRSADGASFAAEEIITGAFRTVAGTVKTIDVTRNEVVITDAQTKKDVVIELGSASVMKKFPEEMAQRLAASQGGGMRPGGPAGAGAQPPANGTPAGGQAGPGGRGGGMGSRGGIDDMLDRFPNISTGDLKTGDVIAVSSTRTTNLERITAIKLLAGVEPFLRAAQAQAAANGGQRGQGTLSLDIPGLDGFSGP